MSVEANELNKFSDSQLDKIIESLELIIELQDSRDQREKDHFASVQTRLSAIEDFIKQANVSEPASPSTSSEEQSSSSWQDQKLNVLSELTKHGILTSDLDEHDDDDEPDEIDDSASCKENELEEEDQPACEIGPPAPADPNVSEPDEIVQLRTELTDKLRLVEVEIGIKQAKLAQQEARIEERIAQLEKREAEISKSLKMSENQLAEEQSTGVLSRLRRHLNVMAMMRGGENAE